MNDTDESKLSPSAMVDTSTAASYIDSSPSWLNKERSKGRGPRFLKVGGRVRYRIRDLDAYLESRVRETSDSRRAAA